MKQQKTGGRGRTCAAIVFSVLIALITAALLVLGRHTALGWVLALGAFGVFRFLRSVLKEKRAALRLAAWGALVLMLAGALAISKPPFRRAPAVTGANGGVTAPVTVAQGTLTGVRTVDGAVEVYAGIPYAAPPLGELRWRAPQPAAKWTGVRACDTFAPRSMQPLSNILTDSLTEIAVYHSFRFSIQSIVKDNWREAQSEDSLYLNIWRPADTPADAKLPVLVYIHGGSLTTGSPSFWAYNGEAMARQGIVVVNLAYRLGVFGYFADPDLAAEDPAGAAGNYGLLDQIAALQWVQDNIAAFGGDPAQVTICGESAGASSVNALCVSPLSEGLFRRAIAESSGITAKVPYHTFRAMDKVLEQGAALKTEFGCADVQALRAVPAEKLVNTKAKFDAMTVDGRAITEPPWQTYEKGENHEEALLSGFNAHESDVFNLTKRVNADNYVEVLRGVLGKQAEAAAELFPPAPLDPEDRIPVVEMGGDAKGSANAVYSAAWFTYSHYDWSRRLAAQGRPCWEYYFSKHNGSLGANHSGELPYVFGNVRANARQYDDTDERLSQTMLRCWVNFARTGDPNGPGLPDWPQFIDAPEQVMEFGDYVGMRADPFAPLYPLIDAEQEFRASEQGQ